VTRRHAPRPLGPALARLAGDLAPRTGLAEVQRVWKAAVGEVVAAQAEPTAERSGVVTVRCSSAVWAQELDLLGPELVERLNEALEGTRVTALRCQAAASRVWSGKDA
jgi:predicted nucleic acid-binding Zn ribbon protein